MLKVGAKVRVINEKAEGIVTQILPNNQVMVEVDGFEIPYLAEEVVGFNEEALEDIQAEFTPNIKFKVGDKVLVKDEQAYGTVINRISSHKLEVNIDGFIYQYDAKSLVNLKDASPVAELKKAINADDIPEEVLNEGTAKERLNRKLIKNDAVWEIDLHIHELADNIKGMTNGQMVTLQLRTAARVMQEAVFKGVEKVIFIHGKGSGKLKTELHHYLQGIDGIVFYDASFQNYGFGATEVKIYRGSAIRSLY